MASSTPTELETTSEPNLRRSTRAHGQSVAKPLAPEDIRRGDYLAVLDEVYEYPSFYWDSDATLFPPHELIRLRFLPREESPPLKVVSVCLPFVLTREPNGTHHTLDLRRLRVARLSRRFATRARKAFKKKPKTTL
jgi:hypothetical protein